MVLGSVVVYIPLKFHLPACFSLIYCHTSHLCIYLVKHVKLVVIIAVLRNYYKYNYIVTKYSEPHCVHLQRTNQSNR